jgi:hypothetical protein
MHEAVGKEHRGKHVPGIAQVKNDLRRIQSSAGHKEAEWPEASISLRNEIFASKDLLERQLFVGRLVRGIIGDTVLLANVAQNPVKQHRSSSMRRKYDDALVSPARFLRCQKRAYRINNSYHTKVRPTISQSVIYSPFGC